MVRVEDRGEGKFDTLTKALQLASYTIQITDNPKVFRPEHAKSTEQIVYLARDIYHRTRVANDIRLDGPDARENLLERRRQQNIAIAECELEKALECIKSILKDMEMELNETKTRIYKLSEGIPFLGFIFRLTDTGKVVVNIKPEKVKHERRKLRRMVELVRKGEKAREKVDEHFESWKRSASYGNNFKMLQRMDTYYRSLWEAYDNEIQKTDLDHRGGKETGEQCGEDRAAGGSDRVCRDNGGH